MNSFSAEVSHAYAGTRQAFEAWSGDIRFQPYVVPPATSPRVGFTIFYTKPLPTPDLLIIGQNPSNFAGRSALTDMPNSEWLSGIPPDRNSYVEDCHEFAVTLRQLFKKHFDLLNGAVGMNVWHFQKLSGAHEAPEDLRLFCESTTRKLIAAIRPKAILCFGRPAFNAVKNGNKEQNISGTKAYRSDVSGTTV